MSVNALEMALWQMYQVPADTQRFCDDAEAYAGDFKLNQKEQKMLASFDVMEMIGYGANPLLVMMAFQSTTGGMERFPEYLATINQGLG